MGGNVPTVMALALAGDTDHRAWDFETELWLTVQADRGPALASTGTHGKPGTDIDFFGRKRAAGLAIEAGPFGKLAGAAGTQYRLWPPAEVAD